MQTINPKPGVDQRLNDLKIELPPAPTPFGAYVETVQTGRLLFLSGMLPVVGHEPKYNGIAAAKKHLGSLDRISRIVRLGVSITTTADFREHPKVADGASQLLENIFGKERTPTRIVLGVVSLPLGLPVELEVIFEIAE